MDDGCDLFFTLECIKTDLNTFSIFSLITQRKN